MQTPEFVDGHHREIFVLQVRLPHLFRFLRPRLVDMVCVGVGEIATELRHTVEFFQPLDTRSGHSPLCGQYCSH